jgi:3-phenylpropionate/cinnamic acid dioxygenase small subunit
MSITNEAALAGLLDKQAITEVLYRYARACDRADEALLRSCFHPDSKHRHGRFEGTSADFVGFAMKIILGTRLEKHTMTNVLIELQGHAAIAESHYMAYHRQPNARTGEDEDFFTGGRFIDRFERRNGEWRIASRLGLVDYERFEAVTDRAIKNLPATARSQRAPDDELYRLMPSLRGPA